MTKALHKKTHLQRILHESVFEGILSIDVVSLCSQSLNMKNINAGTKTVYIVTMQAPLLYA